MSAATPDEGSPEALQMRRELRHRLRRVDALTPPPAPDFAARAIAAARATEDAQPAGTTQAGTTLAGTTPDTAEATPGEDPSRPPALVATPAPDTGAPTPGRRRPRRVLLGLAAAVVIGAVAVPTLPQLLGRTQSDATSTSAGAAAAEDGSATGAPRATVAATAERLTGVATGPTGSGRLSAVVDALRAKLRAEPWSATSVTLLAAPTRVEIVLPASDDPTAMTLALDVARELLPAGTTIRVLTTP